MGLTDISGESRGWLPGAWFVKGLTSVNGSEREALTSVKGLTDISGAAAP